MLARAVLHALNLSVSWEAGEGVELQEKMSLMRISVPWL